MKVMIRDGVVVRHDNHTYVIDGNPKGDEIGIITHAHADHLPSSSQGEFICSDLTYHLAQHRIGGFEQISNKNVELVKSGHILGSRSAVIELNDRKILCTGDFTDRDSVLNQGFNYTNGITDLVIESTYGRPFYKFEEQSILENKIVDFFNSTDNSIVAKSYSLGRAQSVEKLARKAGIENIYVNRSTMNINEVINSNTDHNFSTNLVDDNTLDDGDLLISANRNHVRNGFADSTKAVFTGWALDDRYQNTGAFDESFVLSDHADFKGLINTVDKISPDRVYTVHGYKDTLATEINSRLGITARSLKKDQRTLEEFR